MRDADDRVLAIMCKAPRAGHVKTRLAAAYAPEAIVALYRALVEDTIELARVAGLRTVAICPSDDEANVARWLSRDVDVRAQRGAGLADGLYSTFEQLCTPSCRRVIALNADSPHLPVGVLESAFAALATHDVVVGPCDDGGYYLVGATQPYPGLFDASAMGKRSACEALLGQASRLGLGVHMTAEHWDVDLPGDVARLADALASAPGRAARTAAVLAAWNVAGPRREAQADGRGIGRS